MTTSDVHESSSSPLADRFRTYLPVVIDIETGGFNSATDAVLEISAVILNMDKDEKLVIDQTFFSRVIPFEGSNIEDSALKFTGIDPYHPLRVARPEKVVFQNHANTEAYYGPQNLLSSGGYHPLVILYRVLFDSLSLSYLP